MTAGLSIYVIKKAVSSSILKEVKPPTMALSCSFIREGMVNGVFFSAGKAIACSTNKGPTRSGR